MTYPVLSWRKHGKGSLSNCSAGLLPALFLLGLAPLAQANVINHCSTASGTPGVVLNTCTFSHDTPTLTGTLDMDETFSNTPGSIGVGVYFTSISSGNNIPGIFDYTVTETIHNLSGVTWTGFVFGEVNGTLLTAASSIAGFSSCTGGVGAVHCSGGTVTSGSDLIVSYHMNTPTFQDSGAVGMTSSPETPREEAQTTPEPGAFALLGLGLTGLGWWKRKRRIS